MSIMNLTKIPAFLVATALCVAAPRAAQAQGGVSLAPWAGVYIPTRNSVGDLDNALSRDVSVIGGARLTFWGTGVLGFEATGGYAPAKISGETHQRDQHQPVRRERPAAAGAEPGDQSRRLLHRGGPALLTRGKNTFDDDKSSTDFGGNAGIGLRFGLGERNNSAIRLDLEDYLYNGDFGGGDDFQNDLVASLGVEIPLGGRAGDE